MLTERPMTELPAGTVTFLFTDIEGSTALLRRLGPRYADVLSEHQRILREAFAAHGGHEVDTQGDSFFVAFRRAKDAVAAAVAAQRDLAAHKWPDGVDLLAAPVLRRRARRSPLPAPRGAPPAPRRSARAAASGARSTPRCP